MSREYADRPDIIGSAEGGGLFPLEEGSGKLFKKSKKKTSDLVVPSADTPCLERLPERILQDILFLLSPYDLSQLACTSKSLRDQSGCEAVWKQLFLVHFPTPPQNLLRDGLEKGYFSPTAYWRQIFKAYTLSRGFVGISRKVKPIWVSDSAALHCCHCGVHFGVLKRRHHCRNCGRIFCSKCTSFRVSLPDKGYTKREVRMCCHCWFADGLEKTLLSLPTAKQGKTLTAVTLGEMGSGKSVLIHRFFTGEYLPNIGPTIGGRYSCKSLFSHSLGCDVEIQMWDTTGQQLYKSTQPMYYNKADCVLLVYDPTEQNSLAGVQSWYSTVLKTRPDIIFALVGTKGDLKDQFRVDPKQVKDLLTQCTSIKVHIQTSAFLNENINELFQQIIEAMPYNDTTDEL